jgi:hypothetical protein
MSLAHTLGCDRSSVLDRLPERDREAAISAAALLEQAAEPVPAARLPVDPAVWAAVQEILDRFGRVAIPVGDPEHPQGWMTGYADDIAERLAAEGIGVLDPADRAVLALVLLFCVAIPTTRGQRPEPWSAARPIARSQLLDCRGVSNTVIKDAIRQLHLLGVIRDQRGHGITPGPALDRLTRAQRARLEEDLLLVTAPDDPLVLRIRQRRQPDPDPTEAQRSP